MKTSVEKITPAIALELLRLNTANRGFSQATVNFYAKQMEHGEWKTTSQGIAISSDNMIIDGQHRLMAIVKTKLAQEMLVTRGLNYNEVFAVYDTGKNRTAGDVLSIRGVKQPNAMSAAIKTYVSLSKGKKAGSPHLTGGSKASKESNANIMDIFMSKRDLFENVSEDVLKGISTTTKIISNSLILGVSFYLVLEKNHQVENVRDFFFQLVNGSNIKNQTINLLRNKIIEMRIKGERFNKTDHLVLLKKTWNNYIQGMEVTKFYISTLDRERDFI